MVINYNEEYAKRDYTLNAANLKAAPLIIQGLNDDNVKPKHFELMLEAYKKAGIDAKVLLHQAITSIHLLVGQGQKSQAKPLMT